MQSERMITIRILKSLATVALAICLAAVPGAGPSAAFPEEDSSSAVSKDSPAANPIDRRALKFDLLLRRGEDEGSPAVESWEGINPALGLRFTLRPDQETFTYESPANVDHRGFRTNGPAQGVPRSGITILALGDSFTFGLGVPDDATWPARLEQFLSKTISPGPQVLNIGTVSYGVYQEMDLLKEKQMAKQMAK